MPPRARARGSSLSSRLPRRRPARSLGQRRDRAVDDRTALAAGTRDLLAAERSADATDFVRPSVRLLRGRRLRRSSSRELWRTTAPPAAPRRHARTCSWRHLCRQPGAAHGRCGSRSSSAAWRRAHAAPDLAYGTARPPAPLSLWDRRHPRGTAASDPIRRVAPLGSAVLFTAEPPRTRAGDLRTATAPRPARSSSEGPPARRGLLLPGPAHPGRRTSSSSWPTTATWTAGSGRPTAPRPARSGCADIHRRLRVGDAPGERLVTAWTGARVLRGRRRRRRRELWKSDGTAAGTVLVGGHRPRPAGSCADAGLTAACGGRLFFVADDGVHGRELWVSDGTAAGTRLVEGHRPRARLLVVPTASRAGRHHAPLLRLRRRPRPGALAQRRRHAAGTLQVQDIAPGPAPLQPARLHRPRATRLLRGQRQRDRLRALGRRRGRISSPPSRTCPRPTGPGAPSRRWPTPASPAAARPELYCPEPHVTRAEMAVFLGRGLHGAAFAPPPATGTRFDDVPAGLLGRRPGSSRSPPTASPGVRRLAAALLPGSPAGAGPRWRSSCCAPATARPTRRRRPPAPASPTCRPAYWAAAWIEQLAAEGITNGCAADLYCPERPVTRDRDGGVPGAGVQPASALKDNKDRKDIKDSSSSLLSLLSLLSFVVLFQLTASSRRWSNRSSRLRASSSRRAVGSARPPVCPPA